MKKTTVTCANCGIEINATNSDGEPLWKKLDGKRYCLKCAAPRAKEIEINKKLSDLLFAICNEDRNVFKFLRMQVKRLTTDYEYKLEGILATLKYIYYISDNPYPFRPEVGIEYAVIKNYYKASKYYEQMRKLKSQSLESIDSGLTSPVVEIHLNQNVMQFKDDLFNSRRKDLEYGPEIDLNSIEDEED